MNPILQTNWGWEIKHTRTNKLLKLRQSKWTILRETVYRPHVHGVPSPPCHPTTPSFSYHLPAGDALVRTFLLEMQEEVENNPQLSENESNLFPTDFHFKCPSVFFWWFQRSRSVSRFTILMFSLALLLLSPSCTIKEFDPAQTKVWPLPSDFER